MLPRIRRWLATSFGAAALVLGLPAGPAAAQAPAGWLLKATPQYLVLSGYWLEAEHARPGHPGQSLTLGLQVYGGPAGRPDRAADPLDVNHRDPRVGGAGLLAQHRFYLGKATASGPYPRGFYLGYSPQVQVFRLGYGCMQWHSETGPYGLPYVLYGPVRYHETVLRYGVSAQAGYQWLLSRRVLLDVYAGVGVRKRQYWADVAESQFQSGPSDYAHEGLYVPAGFKLGVAL